MMFPSAYLPTQDLFSIFKGYPQLRACSKLIMTLLRREC